MKYIFFASNSVLFRTAIMVYEVTSCITQKRHSPFAEEEKETFISRKNNFPMQWNNYADPP